MSLSGVYQVAQVCYLWRDKAESVIGADGIGSMAVRVGNQ